MSIDHVHHFTVVDQTKFDQFVAEHIAKHTDGDTSPTLDIDALVLELDDELVDEEVHPSWRPMEACKRLSDRMGIAIIIDRSRDQFVDAVHQVYEKMYRPTDLHIPPRHIGAYMFRDVFLPLRILHILGTVAVNPIQGMKDVPNNTLRWIFQRDDTAYSLYDQWYDLFDFVYGLDDLKRTRTHPDGAVEFWLLAKQQLEGAAATLLGSIDQYTVIQNSVIAMELLLKGALLADGRSEDEVKDYGHKMRRLVDDVCKVLPNADHSRLKLVVNRAPKLVERRYQMKEYSRKELGSVLMDAQYLAGEIMRQFSQSDIRSRGIGDSKSGRDYSRRYYPVLN